MAFRIKPKAGKTETTEYKQLKIVGEIRKSQSITTYGPRSLIDFPRMSSIIDGIDNWESTLGKYNFEKMKIHERNLERILGKKFFVQPQMMDDKKYVNGISIRRFPESCYCPECGALDKSYRIEKKGSNTTNYNRDSYCGICSQSKGRNIKLIPSRFVVSCLSIEISKRTNSLDGIIIKCQCGAKENLDGIMDKGSLHQLRCFGSMPWLGRKEELKGWYSDFHDGEICDEELRVLQRGANNVYYPSMVSALTIPPYSSRVQRILTGDVDVLSSYFEQPEYLRIQNLDYYYESHKNRLRCDKEHFYRELDYALGKTDLGFSKIRDLVKGEYDALCDEECNDPDFLTIESEVPPELAAYVEQIKIVGRLREKMSVFKKKG